MKNLQEVVRLFNTLGSASAVGKALGKSDRMGRKLVSMAKDQGLINTQPYGVTYSV